MWFYKMHYLSISFYLSTFSSSISNPVPQKMLMAGFVFSGVIALYTHNLAIFTLVALDAYLLIKREWKKLVRLLVIAGCYGCFIHPVVGISSRANKQNSDSFLDTQTWFGPDNSGRINYTLDPATINHWSLCCISFDRYCVCDPHSKNQKSK